MVTSSRESFSTQPPSGFRDFLPKEARVRQKLVESISSSYQAFGFSPIDTPALENLNLLQSSGGGEENEKLIFKILKRGDKFKLALDTAENEDALADFGLRFDLTVPLARIVANSRGEFRFPWKVFHIANVWRAERAQRGRFREFTQCDVDIIGSKTSAAELEVLQAVSLALSRVGAESFELKINDRRLLISIAEHFGFKGSDINLFSIVLDKKDKISPDEVRAELEALRSRKLSGELDELIAGQFSLKKVQQMNPEVSQELDKLIADLKQLQLPFASISFDASLARGLSYYTGPVFELRHPSAGYSLGGGGRYDRLIGRFSKEDIPACGFSIGFDRLALLLSERQSEESDRRIFIPIMDENLRVSICKFAQSLRTDGLFVDVYPDSAKLKTQFKYADENAYRWMLIIGEDEWKSQVFKIKDLKLRSETPVEAAELNRHLKNLLLKAD